jgi:hypothetical protein
MSQDWLSLLKDLSAAKCEKMIYDEIDQVQMAHREFSPDNTPQGIFHKNDCMTNIDCIL